MWIRHILTLSSAVAQTLLLLLQEYVTVQTVFVCLLLVDRKFFGQLTLSTIQASSHNNYYYITPTNLVVRCA